MDVGVVGAGPAGAFLSWMLGSRGATVTVFDPTHPREKPCGGGITPAAFSRFDFLDSPALPRKKVHAVTWVSPGNVEVELTLDEPIHTFSRLQLDRYILDLAVRSGAQWIRSKVTDIERKDSRWVIRTEGGTHTCDFLVGADGAHSLVRRTLLGKTPADNIIVGVGYLVGETLCDNIVLKAVAGLRGYIWVFPRTYATSLGICGPVSHWRAKDLRPVLHDFIQKRFPGLRPDRTEAYRATMFVKGRYRSRSFCGNRWALAGDAAGFADPVTFEGIQHALDSARLLATAILEGKPERYAALCWNAFLKEHAAAAELTRYIHGTEFLDTTVSMGAHGTAARAMLADLCSAKISYRTFRRRFIGVVGRRVASKLLRRKWGVVPHT